LGLKTYLSQKEKACFAVKRSFEECAQASLSSSGMTGKIIELRRVVTYGSANVTPSNPTYNI